MKRKVLAYELVGIAFIVILGSLLHFTYELSSDNLLVGVFSAVNESVWEHLKLAFWPAVLFSLIELAPLRGTANNFVLAKTVAVYVMVALIPAIFYAYTAFTGESIFAVDVASFVVAVIVGQLISYRLLVYRQLSSKLMWLSLVFLVALAVLFAIFTFMPPQTGLFQDSITGKYGAA
ncbi:MAG: DUF6512 family protein [Candidatus Bathyarchaeota archaeon]|nr:DUF6512 family protein [Candidatus Bathyarchaeota archaeon]